MDIVRIKWFDPAFSRSGWMDRKEFKEFAERGHAMADTVGFLAFESESAYTVVGSIGEEQVGDAITISKACVTEKTVIGQSGIEIEL